MSDPLRVPGDMVVLGDLYFGPDSAITLPNDTVTNAKVASGDPLDAAKTDNSYQAILAQASTAATETKYVGIPRGVGTFLAFRVIQKTACAGSSTVTVDVKKNGVSILSAAITLNSASAVNTPIAGTITTSSFSADDYLEIVITANQSGTDALATQVMAQLDYNQDYAA